MSDIDVMNDDGDRVIHDGEDDVEEEQPLVLQEYNELDASKIRELARIRNSVSGKSALDDLDALMDEEAAPIDESVLMKVRQSSDQEEETVEGTSGEQTASSGKKQKKKRGTISKKKQKEQKDMEDAVYAQYKRKKGVDEDLPWRPIKYIFKMEELLPKMICHLQPFVDTFAWYVVL